VSLFLGFDCSTQRLSAIVIEVAAGRRQVVFQQSLNFDTDFPHYRTTAGVWRGDDPREASSSPVMWAEALDRMLAIVSSSPAIERTRIRAISGSAQQHGSVYLGREAAAVWEGLNPALPLAPQIEGTFSRRQSPVWMDESTGAQCAAIESALGGAEATRRLTGSRAHERFTAPQIRKFYEIDPTAYARTDRIHLVSSYLASLLVGRDAPIDFADGSGMTLMDLGAGCWSPSAMEATAPDLAARLPPLVPSSSAAGRLSRYWQQRYGLPPAAVVAWTGDNPSSLIGTGNVREDGLAISLGTSDTVFALTATCQSGATHTFGAPTGGYMALVCFRNGSLARERVRDRHGLDWKGFSDALAATPAGNGSALMLPWFEPEITPHMDVPGVYAVGFDEHETARHVRAVVEGQMLAMANHSRPICGDRRRIIATGGASTNRAILQIMADVFDADVFTLPVSNTAYLGAALRAFHFDRASDRQPLSWRETVAGFTDASLAASPTRAHVAIYGEVRQRYAELEARELSVRGVSVHLSNLR
jgi:xylulokinase